MRGSLRLHLFSALVLPPVIVAVVLTAVAITLFREDKELYVFDLSSQSVELVARNLAVTLESLVLRAGEGPDAAPLLLAVRAAGGDRLPARPQAYRVENVSDARGPRLRVIARRGERGVALEIKPETLLDLRGSVGPTELAVVADNGQLLAHRDEALVARRHDRSALLRELQLFAPGRPRVGTRLLELDGVSTLVAFARVADHLAVLQTVPREQVFAAADPLIGSAVLASGGVVLIAVLLAILLGRGIIRPLRLMSQQAEAISRGELGVATESQGISDVGQLMERLNAMSASLKAREQSLLQVQQQLLQSERLNSAGRMIAGIVKELSLPLESCFTLAARTMKQLPQESELRAVQAQILAETDRAANVLQNLSRLSVREEVETRAVELDMAVEDVLVSSRPLFEKHGIRVEADLSPGALVALSPDGLRNALMDILLFVAGEAQAAHAVAVTIIQQGGEAGVSIAYHGEPLTAARCDELLQPFHAAGAGRTSLVLAVAAQVIEEQGGRLVLEHLEGRNRIEVRFGREDDASSSAARAAE